MPAGVPCDDVTFSRPPVVSFAPHTAIPGALLYNYTLPAGRWHVAELVAGLKLAREGDLSQQQVEKILKKSQGVQ
jgi:hypothetical protein